MLSSILFVCVMYSKCCTNTYGPVLKQQFLSFIHNFIFVFCDNLEIKCMGSSTVKIHNENDNSMNNLKAKSDIIKNLNTFTTILCYIRSPFRIKSVRIIFIIISINRIYEIITFKVENEKKKNN